MECKNTNAALVSIIMPTYNQAEYINAAIDSVLAQSYPTFELIVVDNYSIDSTSAIVHSYNDPRIKYLQFDNKGVIAAARNYGVSHSKGNILSFLDSDDIWLPEMLSIQLDLLCDEFSLVSSSFEPIGNTSICRHHLNYIGEKSVKQFSYEDIFYGNPIMTSSVTLYKSNFEDAGGFDESLEFRFIEDWELWLRLSLHKKALVNGAKLLQYRISYKAGRDLRDVKIRTLLIIKKHLELNYISESKSKSVKGNCYVDIGKAHLDVNDRRGVKYYFKGLVLASGAHHKFRAMAGLILFYSPTSLRKLLTKCFYSLNSKLYDVMHY